MSGGERHTIVCFSSQRWDDGMWTNKQHVTSRLARAHDVHYVSFGSRCFHRALYEGSGLSPLRRLLHPRQRHECGLTVVDAWSPSITHVLRHANPLRSFSDFSLRVSLVGRYMEAHGIRDPIVWVYHPGYGAEPARLPHSLLVYDCVDEYTAFPEYRSSKSWMAKRERELIASADVVFCSAPRLYESKRPLKPEHTHLVHNVGDADHFKRALDPELTVPDDIAALPSPVIGFVGAISDYKLDMSWLIELAKRRPNASIVLIGPTHSDTDVSRLVAMPNVHLLGHRPYAQLPAYVKGFDVAVIPYRINDYTRSVFPIKFFEFLASGKPVVISRLPSLEQFYGVVLVAGDAGELVRHCDEALSDTPEARLRRTELASRHTWETRVEKLMQGVESRLAEKRRGQRGNGR